MTNKSNERKLKMTDQEFTLTNLFNKTINFYDIAGISICEYCKHANMIPCGYHTCQLASSDDKKLNKDLQSCGEFELDPHVVNWFCMCKTCDHCLRSVTTWGSEHFGCNARKSMYFSRSCMCDKYTPSTLFIKKDDEK